MTSATLESTLRRNATIWPEPRKTTRREALCQVGTGMGMLGLFGLLGDAGYLGRPPRGADLTGGRAAGR